MAIYKQIVVSFLLPTVVACNGGAFSGVTSTSKQKAESKSPSKAGEAKDIKVEDAKVEPEVVPENPVGTWLCSDNYVQNVNVDFDLKDFNPKYSKGYTIHTRPALLHCTGVAFGFRLVGKKSGKILDLPCNGDKCFEKMFNVPVKSKNSFFIPASALTSLINSEDGPSDYRLIVIPGPDSSGTCGPVPGYTQYGLALAMTGADSIPKVNSEDNQCAGYDLTP